MKKLDKLILQSFLGPLILTFFVAVFILLIQYMLKYFDDFIGKDLGIDVFGKLMMYFSINMIPMALPLAVLVSSLMTYGRLGEHFELTAIKGSGISLLRVLLPSFVLVCMISVAAFFINNNLVPVANLEAYSLLYDIKQTKPGLDLREGQFYDGIPKYSIKINKKHNDGITMNDIILYDHSAGKGNKKVILADSCRMYTFLNDRYLMMELFEGNYYLEEEEKKKGKKKKKLGKLFRTNFDQMNIVFSLASFDMHDTDNKLFAGNKLMKSMKALSRSIDSMKVLSNNKRVDIYKTVGNSFRNHIDEKDLVKPEGLAYIKWDEVIGYDDDMYEYRKVGPDILNNHLKKYKKSHRYKDFDWYDMPDKFKEKKEISNDMIQIVHFVALDSTAVDLDSLFVNIDSMSLTYDSLAVLDSLQQDSIVTLDLCSYYQYQIDSTISSTEILNGVYRTAVAKARTLKSNLSGTADRVEYIESNTNSHKIEKYKKITQALACITMFLIGAPLGAIVKRGGLGFPVIIGIFFFVIYYVFTSVSDKWAKSLVFDGAMVAWTANLVLFPIGLFFLKQARKDAKLFDADFYNVMMERMKPLFQKIMGKFKR